VLTRTLDALTARPDLDLFLEEVLAAVAEQLRSPSAALSFHDADQDAVSPRLVYDRGQVSSPENVGPLSTGTAPLLSQEPELWGDLVRTRQPLVVEDVTQDYRIRGRAWLAAHKIRSLLLVPLLARDTVVGCLSIYGGEPRDFRPEERALARALAQQAMLAVELTHLAEQEQQAAVLEERNRLAGEIHDTLAQGFVGIVIQLDAAEEVLAPEPEAARAHIERARSLARTSLGEARRSVAALRPAAAVAAQQQSDNLPEAFARMVEEITNGWSVKPRFLVEGTPWALAADTEHDLRRIGQEALINAVKHGRAQEIVGPPYLRPSEVELSVRDDGQGFDKDRPNAGEGGFGLTGCTSARAASGLT
jgi:signal transduction histidine kinase